ncbi:MAG: hypothetical protein Q8M95_02895 [Candidatus Methanoperedens sp.]|nr:hypothetical protein [Candidatus Methanoperedens sp.]
MTDTKIKPLNQPGDYYYCSRCAAWHRCTNDPSSTGNQHLSHLNENETNSPTSKYFFCSLCGKWHTDARKDHLQYRLYIQQDHNLNPMPSILPPNMLSSKPSKNPATAILGPFDGTADLWMTESENLSRIRSAVARDHCKRIIDLIKGLDKSLHIQCFSKKKHFTFVVKGMKIAEIMPRSGDFVVTLIHNIKVPNSTKPDQVIEKLVFTVAGNMPVKKDKLINHFISEAKNLIELRKNNAIGYREKWLHSLLIEKMEHGGLPGAELQFLYYEAPAGKIKREAGFKRMHIDILAKERQSKALVIVEVKNDNEDLNAVLFDSSDGKSLSKSLYVEWFMRYRDLIKPRIAQLGWDANIENLKFLIVAPDVDFKNSSLNMDIVENIKSLGCEVEALHLNNDWKETEDVYVVKTDKL